MVKVRFNGQILTHAKSADQQDYTLCGLDCQLKFDIHGDDNSADIGYRLPLNGYEKINCPDCVAVIKHCKKYKAGQIEKEREKVSKKKQNELYQYQKDIADKLKKLDKPIFILMPRLKHPYEEKIKDLQNLS